MKQHVLLTGATGLVGRYLIRDLLLAKVPLAVLVRSTPKATADQRVETIVQFWEKELGKPLPRPVVLRGDVTEPNLGLCPQSFDWVSQNCDRMLHNAAILTFYGSDREGEPWRTNIQGTKNVLEACRKASINDMHYVSTAYVCGQREGLMLETELDLGQKFRNDYEQSKLEAEVLVREAGFEKLTIYRPAVIAGDSRTGYTTTYHGLYMYLKLMSVLVWNVQPGPDGVRDTTVRLSMTGDEQRNVVPVDWVSEVMVHLFLTPSAHGKTYHLSPQERITPKQVVEAGYQYFNSKGVIFTGAAKTANNSETIDANGKANGLEAAARENTTIYQPYESSDPVFDTTNLLQHAGHIPCPKIDVPMLHRFWKYGEEDRWGKRREKMANVDWSCQQWLHESGISGLLNAAEPDATAPQHDPTIADPTPANGSANGNGQSALAAGNVSLSICVLGPGGCTGRLDFRGESLRFVPGFFDDTDAALVIPSSELAAIATDASGEGIDRLRAVIDVRSENWTPSHTDAVARALGVSQIPNQAGISC